MDHLQDPRPIRLRGQRDIKITGLQLEEARQQLGIVHLGAVGQIPVCARTSVNPDSRPFCF